MIRCIILDDEQHAVDRLAECIVQTPFLSLGAASTNGFEVLELLQREVYDLLFLDIHMPGISGLEILKIVKIPAILTTAYAEYAIDGFEHDVIDYLLKPFTYARFLKAATKASTILKIGNNAELPSNEKAARDYLYIKGDYKGKQVRVNHSDIDYIEAAKNYIIFHCGKVQHITKMKIKEVEDLLPGRSFVRIHNSYIIALDKISSLDGNDVWIKHQDKANICLPISLSFRPQLNSRINS